MGSFAFAYGIFEIPVGLFFWGGDFKGPKAVLFRIVLSWSVFTILTGFSYSFLAAKSYPSLINRAKAKGFTVILLA